MVYAAEKTRNRKNFEKFFEKLGAGAGGIGHGYFPAEKFRDPTSPPSRLRFSIPSLQRNPI